MKRPEHRAGDEQPAVTGESAQEPAEGAAEVAEAPGRRSSADSRKEASPKKR
jgi:hypothetical protein